jgi:hypothetical protein
MFDPKNLSVLAYSNGFTLWHYKTIDPATDIDTEGYFNDVSNVVNVGDLIIANTDTDGTTGANTGFFVVLSNTNSVVDVANIVTAQGTDSD